MAAINALKGDAGPSMETSSEMSGALNDDDPVFSSLVAMINAKQNLLSVPSAAGISLLSGTDLRNIQVTGNASSSHNSNRVPLNVSGVSAAT